MVLVENLLGLRVGVGISRAFGGIERFKGIVKSVEQRRLGLVGLALEPEIEHSEFQTGVLKIFRHKITSPLPRVYHGRGERDKKVRK